VPKERDYKAEYKKFQSSTKSKKYRAELNKYNRKKGTYGNGDGKDASHKGGKIVGFESESKNRGRAEKSRLKKEVQVNELVPPMSVTNPAAFKAMLDKQIAKNVKVKTALGNKNHKDHSKAKSLYQRFIDKFKKKKDEPKKSKATPTSAADFRRSRKESVKESDLGLTYKKNKTVKVKHKTSGKRLIIVDKPAVRKEYEKIGYFAESINENDKVKVLKLLIKKGDNPKDAKKDVEKLYNKVSKMYKNASNSKKAEIISALSAKMESVNEASTIDKIKDIVKNKQNMKIGGVRVDMQTANAIMTVHKALGQSNRKKYEKLPIKKMASVAFKLLK
jgi:hypothetical protein